MLICNPSIWCQGQEIYPTNIQHQAPPVSSITSAQLLGLRYWQKPSPPHLFQVDSIFALAERLRTAGESNAAIYWYQLTLPYTFFTLNRLERMSVHGQIARILGEQGNYELALSSYYQAYQIATTSQLRAQALVDQSSVFGALKDYKRALAILDKALPAFEEEHNYMWVAVCKGKQATIYGELKDYHKAKELNIAAYHVAQFIPTEGQPTYIQRQAVELSYMILNNVADNYLALRLPDSAFSYLQQTQSEFNKLSKYAQAVILVSYGEYYLQKGNFPSATDKLQLALSIVKHNHFQQVEMVASGALAAMFEQQGDYAAALKWEKRHTIIKDSLTSFQNIHRVNALETQYALSQKDKLLTQKELQITQQQNKLKERNWIAITFMLVLGTLTVIFLLSRKNYKSKQQLLQNELRNTRQEQKIMQIEATIQGEEKERSRIARELHDGVVSEMLALKLDLKDLEHEFPGLQDKQNYRNVLYQSEEIAMRLRETAHNLMPEKIKTQGLYPTIDAFLQKINRSHLNLTFQAYGQLPPLSAEVERIILLTVMELAQNIVKHSMASEALVQLNYFEHTLSITIEDNGVGMHTHKLPARGIGIKNIYEHVSLLQAHIDIKSSEYTGTTVLIEIPLTSHLIET